MTNAEKHAAYSRLRDDIHSHTNDIEAFRGASGAEADRSGHGIVCPKCGSGSGPHGTGPTMMTGRSGRVCCVRCGPMDVMDVIEAREHCSSAEALRRACERLGLAVPGDNRHDTRTTAICEPQTDNASSAVPAVRTPTSDHRTFILSAQQTLTADSAGARYLADRCIDFDTARARGLGYSSSLRIRDASGAYSEHPCIIVPNDNGSYVYRRIDGPERGNSRGPAGIFNLGAVRANGEPVFVCEGWADALAVECAGGHAAAINSTSMVTQLVRRLDGLQIDAWARPTIILTMDADDAGRAAEAKLERLLTERDWPHMHADLILPGTHDANESRCLDAPVFADRVREAIRRASGLGSPAEERKKKERQAAAESLRTSGHITEFAMHVAAAMHARVDTGIYALNQMLGGGGFYPGLIIIGGRTGCGKTTLAMQIGDYIAENGRPVLYVALEMSRDELIAKSISRIARDMCDRLGRNVPMSYAEILEGRTADQEIYFRAMQQYFTNVAPNVYIVESVGDQSAADVRRTAENITLINDKPPVIVVDYLQIMAAMDPRMSDKQAADKNILALKQLARDMNTPVIALSSLNREAVKEGGEVAEWAFKESGGIEYGADVLLGLARVDQRGPNAEVRDMQLNLLKNRRGKRSEPIGLSFYPASCAFAFTPFVVRPDAAPEY